MGAVAVCGGCHDVKCTTCIVIMHHYCHQIPITIHTTITPSPHHHTHYTHYTHHRFKTLLDIRKSLAAGATQQDKFFTQLHNSADGFAVVADFFGRGLMGGAGG